MTEHPILFSGPMVRAILDGKKTQTRRVVTPQPEGARCGIVTSDGYGLFFAGLTPESRSIGEPLRCPYGQSGDRLWVRETWATVKTLDALSPVACWQYERPPALYYAADTGAYVTSPNRGRWRPSIHMPRWACRITLEITKVRVEQLQRIGEIDAMKEGCALPDDSPRNFRRSFRTLWDSINAKRGYSWESNPWVWVISFKRVN